MNKLLIILNLLQFGGILVLTNPTEADHKKFLAEMGGGVLNTTSVVASVAGAATDATSTSAVAAASATTTKEPQCEYKDGRLISLYRQGDKVVTVGLLKHVYYVGDKFNK